MSGTSLDGIDAALIKVSRKEGKRYHHELIDFQCTSYPSKLRWELTEIICGKRGDAAFFSRLHLEVGSVFGEAARALMLRNNLKASQVSVIGFHGQTIWYESLLSQRNSPKSIPFCGIESSPLSEE
ncbi:MAG: anhydro-N-acetylmuramic acid kinase, partial [Deltaproteobacteria bacterium]|nr:anhydro-N-acetylmuramic acid kinase [Deltaproteobacteria bacterium]